MASTYFILKAGIAPPDLAGQPDMVRLMFWNWVVAAGLKRKDYELARGLNALGQPLPGVAPSTRKHRVSAMTPSGKGDPGAPYLMPGRGLSRTRSLLAGKAHADYAEFFWRYDAHTGDQWGRILAWHAARGKAYDVVGLSPAGIASVAQQAQRRWKQWLLSSPSQSAAATTFQPGPSLYASELGRTNLTFATFGVGSKEQAQKAIDEGRSSGFRTQAEWAKFFRQARGPIATAQAPSVRTGSSNVILQSIWGGQQPPGQPAMKRAAMPPAAPPRPKAKPAPKVAPKPAREPQPSGPPVGWALRPDAKLDARVAGGVRDAIGAIDSVHGDGSLPPIPIQPYKGKFGVLGQFRMDRRTGRAAGIRISAEGDVQRLTTAHEVGHFLEHEAMPKTAPSPVGGRPFLLQTADRRWETDPLTKPWLDAMRSTDAYKHNVAVGAQKAVVLKNPDGATRRYEVDKTFADYLNSPEECFARSYAQYIALRSEDASMRDEVRAAREGEPLWVQQWADDDFEPIAREFDKLFAKLGWRK